MTSVKNKLMHDIIEYKISIFNFIMGYFYAIGIDIFVATPN